MKLSARHWCKIQETLADLKCPQCFSTEVKLSKNKEENAKCEGCGCQFKFDPDFAIHWEKILRYFQSNVNKSANRQ